MTTATVSSAQFRSELEGLLKLATDSVVAEDRIERKARELDAMIELDVLPNRYFDAVRAEVKGALEAARGEHGHSDYSALQLCQDVQNAIDLFDFARERDDAG